MADITESEDAVNERGQHRGAFSWPGRRRADEAAEAAEKAALQGLERLRGRTGGERRHGPEASDPQARGGPPIDLNEASHSDLCAIGMSEAQASRVIRHRDFWGEFQSVSELDHVPGFSPATRAQLDERLSVWAGDESGSTG